MIVLAGALLLTALALMAVLVVSWAADRYADTYDPELDEQEVKRLLYPDGNVFVLERRDPDDDLLSAREQD